ncbi:hypothetical protein LCC91_01470 [Tepidimonas taiwanensis]|uniref:Uncharacterized protein n=1 Tax=Tepidimonas taiwanensis TaxID=307486 RepID=A0A554X551_9BURK|nr:hypothetical protein [Tepidimonas taiwanensis]TSE30961.1 hypothetical protein Ttaiw_01710 [Tepidimonas taiwanensis]UBQ05829.1 hypothetical protein LCC91_01470 [Tepidimonas taiwanensis]
MLARETVLRKTAAGLHEQAQPSKAIGPRLRQLLVMCNGQRSVGELVELFGPQATEWASALLAQGWVEPVAGGDRQGQVSAGTTVVRAVTDRQTVTRASAAAVPTRRRSLAMSRMYMLDMAERLLGVQSDTVRAHLRVAREPQQVVAALADCMQLIEEIADPKVAARVREELYAMLPPELASGWSVLMKRQRA